jgi:hypothetical protein
MEVGLEMRQSHEVHVLRGLSYCFSERRRIHQHKAGQSDDGEFARVHRFLFLTLVVDIHNLAAVRCRGRMSARSVVY